MQEQKPPEEERALTDPEDQRQHDLVDRHGVVGYRSHGETRGHNDQEQPPDDTGVVPEMVVGGTYAADPHTGHGSVDKNVFDPTKPKQGGRPDSEHVDHAHKRDKWDFLY